MYHNSQPKKKRIKLNSKDKAKLRKQVWEEQHGCCQNCGIYVQLQGDDLFSVGHLHHIKTRGAGGGDNRDNVVMYCSFCHNEIHNKGKL